MIFLMTVTKLRRTTYPGACSLFYQAAIQSVYELLGWDPIKNCKKRRGIFGDCIAIVRADEEQKRKRRADTLRLFDQRSDKRKKNRRRDSFPLLPSKSNRPATRTRAPDTPCPVKSKRHTDVPERCNDATPNSKRLVWDWLMLRV